MKGMLNSQDVAGIVGRSVQTIQKWVRGGKIPHRRFNGRLYFDEEEIRAWLDSMPGVAVVRGGGSQGAGERGQD